MKKEILLGDCLELMKDIPDASIDMVLCDLPYGVTFCVLALLPTRMLDLKTKFEIYGKC